MGGDARPTRRDHHDTPPAVGGPARVDAKARDPPVTALFAKATGGAVFRKGIWHGPKTKNPWPIYDTLTTDVHAAAVYADLNL